jgi:hypothetical protein
MKHEYHRWTVFSCWDTYRSGMSIRTKARMDWHGETNRRSRIVAKCVWNRPSLWETISNETFLQLRFLFLSGKYYRDKKSTPSHPQMASLYCESFLELLCDTDCTSARVILEISYVVKCSAVFRLRCGYFSQRQFIERMQIVWYEVGPGYSYSCLTDLSFLWLSCPFIEEARVRSPSVS